MSSPISLELADHRGALLSAVTDVAENSLFALADASDEAAFEASVTASLAGQADDWLRACIQFTGPADGQFELVVPEALAHRLCAAFAGASMPEEVGETDLLDFTGELANMVCGTWLTRACLDGSFSLAPPGVLRSGWDAAGLAGPAPATSWQFYMAIDDTPIRLAIDWHAGQPSSQERGGAC